MKHAKKKDNKYGINPLLPPGEFGKEHFIAETIDEVVKNTYFNKTYACRGDQDYMLTIEPTLFFSHIGVQHDIRGLMYASETNPKSMNEFDYFVLAYRSEMATATRLNTGKKPMNIEEAQKFVREETERMKDSGDLRETLAFIIMSKKQIEIRAYDIISDHKRTSFVVSPNYTSHVSYIDELKKNRKKLNAVMIGDCYVQNAFNYPENDMDCILGTSANWDSFFNEDKNLFTDKTDFVKGVQDGSIPRVYDNDINLVSWITKSKNSTDAAEQNVDKKTE